MSEEKLDLILTVVSDIKGRMDRIENEFAEFRGEFNGLKGEFNGLKGEFTDFKSEFKDFKKQVIQAIKALHNRIDTLEKQIFAIGVELKEEIRREVRDVRDEISRLENTIMLEQAEKLQDRVRVRELESRVGRLEEKFRLAA